MVIALARTTAPSPDGAAYKETEIGPVPLSWEVAPLDYFISYISYGFTNPMPTTSSGIPMITAADISDGRIHFDTARYTSEAAFRGMLTDKSRPKSGDVLLTKDGALGRVAVVPNTPLCVNQSVAVLRPNSRISSEFLKTLLEASTYQARMLEDAGGTTIKHIYITVVNRMPIAVPDKTEQNAIAEAISDTDALIESLEALIAKKRAIKQGAMQDLLSGRKRLPGFSGKWLRTKLGTLARIQRGASPRPIDDPVWFDDSSPIGWVRISDVTSSGMYLFETTQRLSQAGERKSRLVERESLIMSICATVGRPIITRIDVCIHDGFVVFDEIKGNRDFLYYVLQSIEGDWAKHGQTGSQMNLNTALINRTELTVPSDISEQEQIAAVLREFDEEISEIHLRLVKARQLKQGMMQELLTGRIRLV